MVLRTTGSKQIQRTSIFSPIGMPEYVPSRRLKTREILSSFPLSSKRSPVYGGKSPGTGEETQSGCYPRIICNCFYWPVGLPALTFQSSPGNVIYPNSVQPPPNDSDLCLISPKAKFKELHRIFSARQNSIRFTLANTVSALTLGLGIGQFFGNNPERNTDCIYFLQG